MDNLENRKTILRSLIALSKPLKIIKELISTLSWDSEEEVIILSLQAIKDVMSRYLRGELTALDLEDWANLIEGREDIGFEEDKFDQIKQIINELANPTINVPITHEKITNLLNDNLE